MEKNFNNYCVILAGGKGRRLWPSSRDNQPKQFIDFFGVGRTQLQATYDRFLNVVPQENIFVCTNGDYLAMVKEQLPDIDDYNILVEPVNRNTAPSVAWAGMRIRRRNANARIVVSPSDQMVMNEQAFVADIVKGLDYVGENDVMLTMAVKPTRPEPGYGYIQMGDAAAEDIYRVKSFLEKPERKFAEMLVDSGEFYWNTGMFLMNTNCLQRRISELFPDVMRYRERMSQCYTKEDERAFIGETYPTHPNLSIDYAVLEHNDNVYMMSCDFGWADLGTWHSIYECMRKSDNDNVVIDSNVLLDDCQGNVIKMPKGKLAVINGLEGYIIAEQDNVLLICKKGDSSSLVRKYVNEVGIKFGEKFI